MFCSEVHHWVHLVSVFLQECILTLFDLHPQTLVQNNFAFLQLQRRLLHPVEHEHEMISWQAFGIGSCFIRSGWSLLSAIFFCPNVSGSGRWGSEQWACFHTIDPFIWFPIAFWKHIDLWRPRSCTTSFFWYSCIRLGQLSQKRTSVGKFEEKLVNTLFLIKIMCWTRKCCLPSLVRPFRPWN